MFKHIIPNSIWSHHNYIIFFDLMLHFNWIIAKVFEIWNMFCYLATLIRVINEVFLYFRLINHFHFFFILVRPQNHVPIVSKIQRSQDITTLMIKFCHNDCAGPFMRILQYTFDQIFFKFLGLLFSLELIINVEN